MIKRSLLSISFLFFSISIWAQKPDVEMADTKRDNGKIYVVVAVILAIFIGIIIYLIRLDKKMTRLEKDIHSKI